MGKRRYNWKARQVVETTIEPSTSKVQIEFGSKKTDKYDDCNSLVIPSKKRKTFKKKENGQGVTKILSKSQRKKLNKIVERKKKKENRSSILEALAKVQAPEELLNQLTSISQSQTKGLKRHYIEEKKGINIIKGANKKRRKYMAEEEARKKKMKLMAEEGVQKPVPVPRDPNVVGLEDSSDESDVSEEEEEDVEDEKINKDLDIINKDGNILSEKDKPSKTCNNGINQTLIKKDIPSGPLNEYKKNNIEKSTDSNAVVDTGDKRDDTSSHSDQATTKVKSAPVVFVPVARDPQIQESRLKLPILSEEQLIMEAIQENDIIILAGETGSGKTTQVPQFLYEAGYTSDGKLIGITEPRRLAAISMSQRVAKELNMGQDKVSYLIRAEGNVTPKTEIKFMTDGVLMRELEKDFSLSKYSAIILDEAHERRMYTDVLIGMLSRIVPLRRKRENPLKLIIMSATLRLSDFTENRSLFKKPPPVIRVDSRQFPVTVHYNRITPQDYVKEAYRKACKIHTQLPAGGILIFLTGQQEVNLLVKKLRATFPSPFQKKGQSTKSGDEDSNDEPEVDENLVAALKMVKKNRKSQTSNPLKRAKKNRKSQTSTPLPEINLNNYQLPLDDDTEGDMLDIDSAEEWEDEEEVGAYTTTQPLWVLPLYSLLPSYRQAQVFNPPPNGSRLCVVSTDVAETSLTIPQVKYVVDCGKTKTKLYDKQTGVTAFDIVWTSKASANQRAGRAGRTSDGYCYRLYSSAVFNNDFREWSVPEIQQIPIDGLLLQMKSLGMHKVVNFPFPSPPDVIQMQSAERRLIQLGALESKKTAQKKDEWCSRITPLGESMSVYPVAPRFAKMLSLSDQLGLMNYTIAIVAALTVQEFLVVGDKRWLQIRRQWAGTGHSLLLGDVAVLLSAVGGAEFANSKGKLEEFCTNYGLRHKAVVESRKLRLQLTSKINSLDPKLALVVDPKMEPPNDIQSRNLRQLLLSGMVDQVARKLGDCELQANNIRKGKPVYRTPDMEEVIHLSTTSALYKTGPEWIVYQEIYQTDKMYFRGVTAIEPEWLPIYAPSLCNLSAPLTEPSPRFNTDTGTPFCHFSGSFGKGGWTLPVVELEYPEGLERYKWFAMFLLDGSVCPKLKMFRKHLLSSPQTMVKTWASLQPRTDTLLKALILKDVDSKASLLKQWELNPNYLLSAYQCWLPLSAHNHIAMIWPPK